MRERLPSIRIYLCISLSTLSLFIRNELGTDIALLLVNSLEFSNGEWIYPFTYSIFRYSLPPRLHCFLHSPRTYTYPFPFLFSLFFIHHRIMNQPTYLLPSVPGRLLRSSHSTCPLRYLLIYIYTGPWWIWNRL